MIKKLSLILALVLVTNHAAAAADTTGSGSSSEEKSKTKTVPITMLIPGIQQLKSRKYVKGSILLGAFISFTAAAFSHNKKGNDHYDRYRNSTNVEEVALMRRQTEKSFKKRNLFIAGMFSVWLIHMIDLKFSRSGKAGVKGEVGKNNINIGFYYKF